MKQIRYRPSYNVSPGSNLPVVRRADGSSDGGEDVVLECMKWGLIPSFTKKTEKPDHYKMVMVIIICLDCGVSYAIN